MSKLKAAELISWWLFNPLGQSKGIHDFLHFRRQGSSMRRRWQKQLRKPKRSRSLAFHRWRIEERRLVSNQMFDVLWFVCLIQGLVYIFLLITSSWRHILSFFFALFFCWQQKKDRVQKISSFQMEFSDPVVLIFRIFRCPTFLAAGEHGFLRKMERKEARVFCSFFKGYRLL